MGNNALQLLMCKVNHKHVAWSLSAAQYASMLSSSSAKVTLFCKHNFAETGFFTAQVKDWSGAASVVHQEKVHFSIWKSHINNMLYTDAPCMQQIGELVLAVDDPEKVQDPDKYKFKVSFNFGQTEMTVTAVDQQTNKQLKTQVLFIAEE